MVGRAGGGLSFRGTNQSRRGSRSRLSAEVAGLIQFSEEPEPKYRHASIDLFLQWRSRPWLGHRGAGGPAALTEERGHHRITIDPAAENPAAVRAYEKAGFAPVGIMRSYERDVGGGLARRPADGADRAALVAGG